MKDELARLRAELDALDGKLLELAAERMRVVAEVGRAKQATGTGSFDRERERAVLERAEKSAEALGMPAQLGRSLIGALVEASHTLQEHGTAPATAQRSMLLVGGHGRMGRMLHATFERRGHTMDVIDRDDALDPERVARADVVIVAVPMTVCVEVTRALGPLMRPDAVLCDINSLKSDVCAALGESARGAALGTHPMFGPTVRSLRRQKIILCRIRNGPMATWLEGELGRMGAELVVTDPETHDRMMAVVQVLTHFGIMVMGHALAQSGMPLDATLPFMSPIYRLELAMVGRLFSQQADLYREILLSNRHGEHYRRLFVAEAEELAAIVARGDGSTFTKRFDEARDFFRGFSAEAMELSDHIIDDIMSRP
jgi:chorismate mutase/prephenate dehydrogenase